MLGVCDRAALTKPCGNTQGAADRREERGSVTDGQNAAELERQPGLCEWASKCEITAVKCVFAGRNRKKGVKGGIRGERDWGVCCSSVPECDVCFAGTFYLAFNTLFKSLCYRYSPRGRASFPICCSVYFYWPSDSPASTMLTHLLLSQVCTNDQFVHQQVWDGTNEGCDNSYALTTWRQYIAVAEQSWGRAKTTHTHKIW